MIAWSYSSLTSFETCPRRHFLTKISKTVIEPQTDALRHGNEVHKAIELALLGKEPLPSKYGKFEPMVNAVSAAPGTKHVELGFGLRKDLTQTTFFAKDVWVRGKLDLAVVQTDTAVVVDWKTGKPKPDADQLELFGAAAFVLFPNVETVKTGYAWLADNKLDRQTFKRGDAPAIWSKFSNRVLRMEQAAATNEYPPRPSGLCGKWCPVPRRHCEFSGKA